MDLTLSKSERETLKAMYRLTKAGADAHTGDLAEALGLSPGTVTATVKRLADPFEHALPQEVEDRLFVALDRPSTCPHGFPIPKPETADIPEMPPLYALEPGDVAMVALPGSTDPEVVAFLDTLGLRPGVRVEVREKHPFDGPLVLRVAGEDRTVSQRVAQQIFVTKETERREQSA